jgi:hypothetical protein
LLFFQQGQFSRCCFCASALVMATLNLGVRVLLAKKSN